jgi:membrane protein DedA with SNARE-associated domain
LFALASFIGRGGRFFLVAYLMHHFGRRYKDKIEKYIDILGFVFIALIVLGFIVVKVLL